MDEMFIFKVVLLVLMPQIAQNGRRTYYRVDVFQRAAFSSTQKIHNYDGTAHGDG